MKISRRKKQRISQLMLALAFFTQGILSAHACVSADASAAHAVTMQQAVADEMPCHHAERASANECLTHCTQSDQNYPDDVQLTVSPATEAVIQIVLHDIHDSKQSLSRFQLQSFGSGPPLSIRYCTFRI